MIITIILAVWTCVSPFFYYSLFREEKTITEVIQFPKKKKKIPELTEDMKYMYGYAENVDSFYGVGSKQNKLKRGK